MKYAVLIATVLFQLGIRPTAWIPQFDHGNRFEGLIDVPRSSAGFEVLSFVKNQNQTDLTPQIIRIRYFTPRNGNVVIYGRELIDELQYRMESKPLAAHPGWNDFSWSSNDVISPAHLSLKRLGFLAVLRSSNGRDGELLPASLFDESIKVQNPKYTLVAKSQYSLKSLSYFVLRQSPTSEVTLRKTKLDRAPSAGDPFPIPIDMTGIPDGSYLLRITGDYAFQAGGFTEEYAFCHTSNP
jgi:hypothetical protein